MSPSIVTPKEPAVDLIRILGEGTYTSFPQALKEFISNSYDAFATEVRFQFDDDFSNFAIRDDGEGMSREDFMVYSPVLGEAGRVNRPVSVAFR